MGGARRFVRTKGNQELWRKVKPEMGPVHLVWSQNSRTYVWLVRAHETRRTSVSRWHLVPTPLQPPGVRFWTLRKDLHYCRSVCHLRSYVVAPPSQRSFRYSLRSVTQSEANATKRRNIANVVGVKSGWRYIYILSCTLISSSLIIRTFLVARRTGAGLRSWQWVWHRTSYGGCRSAMM
jgi:hypothetical protein